MEKTAVLVVEDVPAIALDILNILRLNGYTAKCVDSGEEALEELRKTTYDLILMDIMLKGALDGIDTSRQIRKTYGDIPIIFTTSHSTPDILERVKPIKPFCYLIKPLKKSELLSNIALAVSASATRKDGARHADVVSREELDYLLETHKKAETGEE